MQNRHQIAGDCLHRASPRLCELDGITSPALKLGRNCCSAKGRLRRRRSLPDLHLALALDLEDHRKGKIQSLVGDERRWLRDRVGGPYHRERRFVERLVAGSLDNAGRETIAQPVQREAVKYLRTPLRAF